MAKKTKSPKVKKGKENQEAINQNNDEDTTTNKETISEPLKPNIFQEVGNEEKTVEDTNAIEKADNIAVGNVDHSDSKSPSKKRKHQANKPEEASAANDGAETDTINNAEESNRSNEDNDNNDDDGDDDDDEAKPPPSKKSVSPPIDLEKPIKRARTAYFIFSDERRAEVQGKHKGEGVAAVARELGQIWAKMSAEEKNVYQEKAAMEREEVAQQLAQLQAAGIELSSLPGAATLNENGSSFNPNTLIYPMARIRKICKLDPEVRNLSKEATLLVTKCAELVTGKLGLESVLVAQIQNRRKLLPEDIAQVCSTRDQFLFLNDDVKDLVREQVLQKQKDKDGNPSTNKNSVAAKTTVKSKSLTSFFAPVSNGKNGS